MTLACALSLTLQAGALPKPLWTGSRYSSQDRDRAVERGLRFVAKIAADPKNFREWGHDLLWCFYSIGATAKNPKLRAMARAIGEERARQWRRDHPEPPLDDAGELSDFVFGADTARRLGVPDNGLRERVRRAVAQYTAADFLDFDPAKEPPPSDIPRECPKCQYQNRRGVLQCRQCNTELSFHSRYEVWRDALIATYTGDVYGVKLGASYDDVLRWISAMRPYPTVEQVGFREAGHVVYAITHVVYTLNDYGRYRLSPAWLPEEFDYLKTYLTEAAKENDPEMLGEFMDTLRAFGLSEKDELIRAGVEYQLAHQNPDGSWGDMQDNIYSRYHSTWTAVDGLREYRFHGERLRRPELMAIIQPRGKSLRARSGRLLLPKHGAAGDLLRLRVKIR
ncbi:MAG TPA: hypothetical protein VEU96_24745 [Bryobacteraceae bacterium]|nr:hypothetical protein [Bryobacteraceae bacterium]